MNRPAARPHRMGEPVVAPAAVAGTTLQPASLGTGRDGTMEKERLLAFTDGVIAVIITIMVLEMKVPQDATLGALGSVIPVFLSYVLSFVYVAIYWNNHHQFLSPSSPCQRWAVVG